MQAVCGEIAADAKRDASAFDGQPFNGRTVAEYFGNHGAAIAGIARILEKIIVEIKMTIEEVV